MLRCCLWWLIVFYLRASEKAVACFTTVRQIEERLCACVGFKNERKESFHLSRTTWCSMEVSNGKKAHECIDFVFVFLEICLLLLRCCSILCSRKNHQRHFVWNPREKVSRLVNLQEERKSHSLHVLYLLETGKGKKCFWEAKKLHKA